MNHLELQQQVQRFGSELISRVTNAGEPLAEEAKRPELRQAALNRVLLYSSSALDISTGPAPQVNVLDMAVFVRLSRAVLERHFVPKVFGDAAQPLLAAFWTSETEILDLASQMLGPQEFGQLITLTDAWLEKHPDNVNVEVVRFREFAGHVGELVPGFDREAQGLFSRMTAATQTADHAVLLAERALFLAQRMPFLIRMQARLGVHAILRDCMRLLEETTKDWLRRSRALLSPALLAASGTAALWGGFRLITRPRGRRLR